MNVNVETKGVIELYYLICIGTVVRANTHNKVIIGYMALFYKLNTDSERKQLGKTTRRLFHFLMQLLFLHLLFIHLQIFLGLFFFSFASSAFHFTMKTTSITRLTERFTSGVCSTTIDTTPGFHATVGFT